MMIVSVTRDPRDLAAIRDSGVRATLAPTVREGLEAASAPDVRLIVCDIASDVRRDLSATLRGRALPCPLVLRHDLNRQAIESLYDVARVTADVRSSFRGYDDLRGALTRADHGDEAGATGALLAAFAGVQDRRLREFIAVMAVLGERRVSQPDVARATGRSTSSFRAWMGVLRSNCAHVPAFPRLNGHFVALHHIWRRDRLGWTGKRAAVTAGFPDDKSCATYLRYHLGRTGGQLLRAGGFDARVTAVTQLFCLSSHNRDGVIRRI